MFNKNETVFKIYMICNLDREVKEEIKEFLINVYSDNPGYKNSVYSNPDQESCMLLYKEGDLIGHVGITKRLVSIEDRNYLVAGIGDVAIKTELQGKGFGKLLMKKVDEVIESKDYDLGLLFCHPKLDSFYRGCGWVKKEKGKIFVYRHGKLEDQRLSYLLPLKVSSEDSKVWNNEDINIGEGSW